MEEDIKKLVEEKLEIPTNKQLYNIVFIGHVDAGKSTICGRMLVDLEIIDKRTLEKYKKEAIEMNRASWYLSWCMDTNPEERERGKTQELGISSSIELEKVIINIIDAPGHLQFIDNMIDGASRANLGILIVSARANEFESGFYRGGQTKEHLRLLSAGNCTQLAVLINKMDDCNWSGDRFLLIKSKILKFIKTIFKNDVVEVIPCSGYLGDNILQRKNLSYYDGPTFIEFLNNFKPVPNLYSENNQNLNILTVVEKVKLSNATVIYVKVDQGSILKNQLYALLPLKNKVDKILNIYNDEDSEVETTLVNNTYKIRLSKMAEEISKGQILVYPNNAVNIFTCSRNFIAKIGIYEVNTAITVGYSFVLHCNLQMVNGKIIKLYDFNTKKAITVAKKGQLVLAKILTDNPLVFRVSKNYKDKFSLRSKELTIGIGQFFKNNSK